jgi:hypothetical protein
VSPFFHGFNFPVDRPPTRHVPPAWTGPSEYELGLASAPQAVLGRTDRVVVILDTLRRYSNGLELVFEVICRDPLRLVAFKAGTPLASGGNPGGMRVGYASSDGHCAGEQPTDMSTLPRDAEGIPHISVIVLTLGRVGQYAFELRAWCWPLPAQGPMTVYVEWPELGIPESTARVDVDCSRNSESWFSSDAET